ncbi:MAG: hypothetical protein K2H85_06900, partial [Allobaculum sp.]|nr:hypothetical protein [Allobaculum sp.]
ETHAQSGYGPYMQWAVLLEGKQTKNCAMPMTVIDLTGTKSADIHYGLFLNEGQKRITPYNVGDNFYNLDVSLPTDCPTSYNLLKNDREFLFTWINPTLVWHTAKHNGHPVYFKSFVLS